jgi:hypothetical protein
MDVTSTGRVLVATVVVLIALTASTEKTLSAQLGQDPSQDVQSAPLTAEALQQLVAPVALYPERSHCSNTCFLNLSK